MVENPASTLTERFGVVNDTRRFAEYNDTETRTSENLTYTHLINCTGVLFKNMNEEFDEREQQALMNGRCINSTAATSMIKGTEMF